MKKVSIILVVLLFMLAGCGGNKQATDDFIIVDVNGSYPEKELILQDVMDVEYVVLETTDEFITRGVVEDIGKNIILVRNYRDGDIFVFDRSGKGLRKINRFGQSGEEYSQIGDIILDEDNNEMFVKDYPARKILVYDLYGNFKRSFKFTDTGYYDFAFNYDRDNLIFYKSYLPIDNEQSGHIHVSKLDGSITREIHIPVDEIVSPKVRIEQDDITITPAFYLTTPSQGYWFLMNTSSDTIYNYFPDNKISPFIVRTPAIHSMEVDDPVYDKQEKTIYRYSLYNSNYSNKQQVYWSEALNQKIATWQHLEAPDLVEAYKEGRLKGKLKEIATELDEDSNPVIMLLKHKK
ncbi:hypothetical protein FACS189414_3980 [Bacteroidia bacterium]|nr:hypothetical protein FACS189414_3980 [Bacteroidia bacterium]